MQKFVQTYLSASFEIRKRKFRNKITLFGFDAIYTKENQIDVEDNFIYGSKLIKELTLAAFVDEVTLRKYINKWVEIYYPNADLKTYWEQEEEYFSFPEVTRVTARTIGMELVPVQPMSGPRGDLVHLDYSYSGDTPNINGRVYHQEVFNENIAQLIRNQINAMIGENNQPDLPMAVALTNSSKRRRKKDLED